MKAKELRDLKSEQLIVKLNDFKSELFSLRFQLATGQLENTARIKMVKKGGYFATCSCSHYMSEEQLKKTVCEAAHDARRTLRQIEVRTQSCDHPILWNLMNHTT